MNKSKNKEEDNIFKTNHNERTYGNVKDSDTLNLAENRKRLKELQNYGSKLCDIMDGTSNNYKPIIKDFYRLLDVVECDFLDCNKSVKDVILTEKGLGQLYVWITIIECLVGN